MPVSSSTHIANVTVVLWLLVARRFSAGATTPSAAPATPDSTIT